VRVIGWLGDFYGCGHYRMYFPFQLNGWDVTDRAITEDADVIVAQRAIGTAASACFQQVAANPTKTAVLELDDDLLHIDPSNPAHEYFSGPVQQRALRENLAAAQLVTVSTEPLAELYRPYTNRVVVLPNYIPRLLLHVERPVNDRIVIGWAGSASHHRDFGELAKPLRRVLQRYAGRVEFHCIGTDYTPRVRTHRSRTRFTGWTEDVWSYYDQIDFDIGLAPLFPSRFNESKSDLRLKELTALGVPTIASDVGPYATTMREGCPAVPASTHKDWEQALTDLIENAEQRLELSTRGRAWAEQHTVEAHAYRWRDAYEIVHPNRLEPTHG
jgi:glycosyltransferase involved in cell wall biosynthesis